MYIETIFGLRWRIPTSTELILIIFIIVLIILVFVFIRLLLIRNQSEEHENQYILFRAKQKGLTNYQYRILNGMIRIIKLPTPSDIFKSSELFEKSIGSFIKYVQNSKQDEPEMLVKIMKDIVITYEKLYLNAEIRKPLQSPELLEAGHFIFFYTDKNRFFLGKLATHKQQYLILKLFRLPAELGALPVNETVHCYLWRSGDAEYTFDTLCAGSKDSFVYLVRPETFERGAEVRLPYVSTLTPCSLVDEKDVSKRQHQGTIIRLAEHEVTFQSSHELRSGEDWNIEFVVDEFTIHCQGTIISEKNVSDKKIVYITFKFSKLSDAARSVIKRYIVEHLPG